MGPSAEAAPSFISLSLWEPARSIFRSLTCLGRSLRTCWGTQHLGHRALQPRRQTWAHWEFIDGAGQHWHWVAAEHELGFRSNHFPSSWVNFTTHLLQSHGDRHHPSEVMTVSTLRWLTPGTKHIFEEKVQIHGGAPMQKKKTHHHSENQGTFLGHCLHTD